MNKFNRVHKIVEKLFRDFEIFTTINKECIDFAGSNNNWGEGWLTIFNLHKLRVKQEEIHEKEM